MLLPRAETRDLQRRFAKDGSVDLGAACVSKVGKASIVELRNPGALNALDETTLAPLETVIDLAILDKSTEIAILRGGTVEHPKYAGRRIFSAGNQSNPSLSGQNLLPILFSARDGLRKQDASRHCASLMLRLTTWQDPLLRSLGLP